MREGSTIDAGVVAPSEGAVASGDDVGDRRHARILWAVIGVLALAVCIRPIGSSLWLDELGTWWVAKDGFRDVIARSWEIQGQSPLYYLVAWATRELAGPREWALRLPSVAFAVATAFIVFRLARRMVDTECARLSVLMLVAFPAMSFAAIDFRPYALATFLATATVAAFVVWLDEGRARWGLAFVALGASTVYAHYMFGSVLIALLVFAVWRLRAERDGVAPLHVAMAYVAIGIVCAPLATQMFELWRRRSDWTQGQSVSVDWIATVVLPSVFIVGGAIGLTLARTQGRLTWRWRAGSELLVLCVSWVAVPVGVLVAITLLSDADVAIARYALVSAPAIALLLGSALRSIGPSSARRIIACTLAIVVVLAVAKAHHSSDWRGSMAAAGAAATPDSLVVVQPGFIESDQASWLTDPQHRSFLLAPLSLYPTDGQIVLMPLNFDASTEQLVRQQIKQALPSASNVILVNGGNRDTWLLEVLGSDRWTESQLPTMDEPYVKLFTRVPA